MRFLRAPALGLALGSVLLSFLVATPARSSSSILIDAASGKVLRAENATYPWYPASTTKLMTLYMTLSAIRDHRITFDTLFTVSPNASSQAPTKMGFPVGTQVTVDNALKMMMVKSANDMAVLLAEGIGGSVDDFAQQMTDTAHRLGMSESNFVNPNGLPADGQIMSARDLAMLARALIRDFPENNFYWHIPAIKWGRRVVHNYNPLIGRYPGADGMKTGFICASGFNLVATATRNNKQLIAVVLGAPSGSARAIKAAELLENGFNQNPLSWLTPALGTVDALTPIDATPPNLKDEMCGPHRKRPGHRRRRSGRQQRQWQRRRRQSADVVPDDRAALADLQGPAGGRRPRDAGRRLYRADPDRCADFSACRHSGGGRSAGQEEGQAQSGEGRRQEGGCQSRAGDYTGGGKACGWRCQNRQAHGQRDPLDADIVRVARCQSAARTQAVRSRGPGEEAGQTEAGRLYIHLHAIIDRRHFFGHLSKPLPVEAGGMA